MPNPTPDFLAIVAELNVRRLRLVLNAIAARAGGNPSLPQPQVRRMIVARSLHERFRTGNYTATVNEWREIKELCNWLVREHDRCIGRTPRTEDVEMPDSSAFAATTAPPDIYRELCRRIADGTLRV